MQEENLSRIAKIEAAHRAAGLAGSLRSRLMAERLARKSQDGTLGQASPMHEDDLLKDMNVNVGDTIVHQATNTKSGLGKAAVAAALLATGGLGAGLASLPYLLDKGDAPTITTPADPITDTDTDTRYKLRISSGQ